MEFSREELRIIFHALCLAESYYNDPDRRVKGMVPPSPQLVMERLNALGHVVNRITRYAKDLL